MAADEETSASPRAEHEARRARYQAEADRLERMSVRLSLANLGTIAAALATGIAGVSQGSLPLIGAGGALFAAFIGLYVVQGRLIARRDLARVRAEVHVRHLARLDGTWMELASTGAGLVGTDHPYGFDLDLTGPGSLFQRIDVTHTRPGERTLAKWLGEPASEETIAARQEAVRELAGALDLREELEASALIAAEKDKLDPAPFLAFTKREPVFDRMKALVPFVYILPATTMGLVVLDSLGVVPRWSWTIGVVVQGLVFLATSRFTLPAFELVSARRRFAEAYSRVFATIEGARFESEALRALKARLERPGVSPSSQMKRLDRWAGLAELRTQVLLHFPANVFLLWDLIVLLGLERWNRTVGEHMEDVFDAVGELEALASLATLAHGDPAATYPAIAEGETAFVAEALAHPLLRPETRVANDVALRGAGTALIITGSNMAGKSTLLRAIGLNLALALAGGPVTAGKLVAPHVRLRASMRANDDLQRGASYFHAELQKLRGVVADAEEKPPIFFLLDELLRGTNAHARHLGARSVLLHLLDRGATGLVATHDVALSKLELEMPEKVANAHFTDVVIDGEMTFDYHLKPGVVRTSNALRLLKMAGIDVPDDDSPVDDVSQLPAPR